MSDRPPIVVLLGGPSAEHDVSIVSGTAIAEALADAGYDVEQVLIDLDGGWWWLPAGHRRDGPAASAYDDPAALGATGPITVGAAIDRLAAADPAPVVFIALHGPFGEDGTVQALLEAAGRRLHGLGRRGVGHRHGQDAVQAAVPRDRPAGRRLARDPGRPLGRGPGRRPRGARRVRRGRRGPAADGQAGRGSGARSG